MLMSNKCLISARETVQLF